MELEQDTTARRVRPRALLRADGAASATACDAPLLKAMLQHTTEGAPRFLATAPIKLDVMSGMADYMGALVLQMPLAAHVTTVVQPCDDAKIRLTMVSTNGEAVSRELSSAEVVDAAKRPLAEAPAVPLCSSADARDIRCLLGVTVEAARAGFAPDLERGVHIISAFSMDGFSHQSVEAAQAAATLTALAGAKGAVLDPSAAIEICQMVVNKWMDIPVGRSDTLCALWGEAGMLTQLYCEPSRLVGSIGFHERLAVLGVDCGAVRDGWRTKFEQARTAAFMGRYLIDRIIKFEGGNHTPWDGYLARLTVADFVGRFRNRIPTKLKGEEFLNRFGDTGDPLTTTDPGVEYKVRSRTEHHIYEHARSWQFVDCLSRFLRGGDEGALGEIRDLMDASHWSYGQRCGLGCVETDLLANLVRQHGRDAGLIGCRVSGRGCGGMLTVMLHATQKAYDALHAAIDDYEQKSGRTATIFAGSRPGALHSGCRPV